MDQHTGHSFYFDRVTLRSVWEPPEDLKPAVDDSLSDDADSAAERARHDVDCTDLELVGRVSNSSGGSGSAPALVIFQSDMSAQMETYAAECASQALANASTERYLRVLRRLVSRAEIHVSDLVETRSISGLKSSRSP